MTTNVILIKSLKTDREISNRCQINNVLWSFLRFDFYFIATIKEEIGLKKKTAIGNNPQIHTIIVPTTDSKVFKYILLYK